MQWRWRRGLAIASRVLGIAVATVTAAGCVTTQSALSPEHAHGATVAFESLDGAPRETTARLLTTLNEEAKAQRLVVAARGGQANYRLRGYVSVDMETRAIAWAWDIYDGNRRRVSRVTGIEPGRSFDEALVARVARTSLEQVTAAIAADRAPAATTSASTESPPAERRSIFSAFDDFRPEAAGIVRIFGPSAAEPTPIDMQPAEIPLPRRRPGRGATPTSVAFAAPGQ